MAFKKTFVVSDETVNCYGFVVKTAGIRLDGARKNCPAYFNHQTSEIPLGHWENLRVEGTKLMADIVIEGSSEVEKTYITKIQNGDIKGASIGADPLVWNADPLQLVQGQTAPTLEECDLFELSLAPLNGNRNALALKHQNNLVTLTATNQNDIVPNLKPKQNMKEIAVLLGLPGDATEAQIMAAINKIQLVAATVNNYQKAIESLGDDVDEMTKDVFVELSKTNPEKAAKFLKAQKTLTEEATETPGEENKEKPVQLQQTPGKKAVSVVSLIQPGKGGNGVTPAGVEEKECFDYMQRKDPQQLARIRQNEPERYTKLAAAYGQGKRYTGK